MEEGESKETREEGREAIQPSPSINFLVLVRKAISLAERLFSHPTLPCLFAPSPRQSTSANVI